MAFPSLVGGTLVREDQVPAIIFAILYGCLVPLAAFRLLGKRSRTTLLIGATTFSIERIVVFSFRAIQSRNQAKAGSHGLATYEQLTIGLGFIGISGDTMGLLRVLLVNATHPDLGLGNKYPHPNLNMDCPRERFWYRRLTDFIRLALLSATVTGIVSGSNYGKGIDHPDTASQVMKLRYASAGVTLLLVALVGIISAIALLKLPRVKASGAYILIGISALILTVTTYRLIVMHNTVDSLLSRGPGSLSSPSAKALFYIFHMLPEWIVCALLLGLNTRKIFATGPFGDWRGEDPKPPKGEKKAEPLKDEDDSNTRQVA